MRGVGDDVYPLPTAEQDWYTTYYGGRGYYTNGRGIQYAIDQGSLVRPLIDAGVPASVPVHQLCGSSPTMPLLHNEHTGPSDGATPGLVEDLSKRRLARPQSAAAWLAQSAASLSHDAFDRLGQIAAPALVLHGTADRVVDPRNAPLLAERIPGARLEMLEGLGHLFFWEDPDRTVRLITRFLSDRTRVRDTSSV